MVYYGTHLSENISRREPEGYLLCLNVPVARTGTQEYLPEELGMPAGPEPVPVYRPELEVFAPETIASFEGMPVTNNHPPDGVTIENIRALQKGHAHNVRRGSGEEADLLLADLIITDPVLIDAILAGKREISCGYTYELCEEDGQYIQRKIRGNHVAVVDAGRAGPRVSIRDQEPSGFRSLSYSDHERSKPIMKKSLLKKLTCMARDGDPEAIEALAEAVEEIIEAPSAEPEAAAAVIAAEAGPDPVPEAEAAAEEIPAVPAAAAVIPEGIAAVLERLDRLIDLLTPAAPAEIADADPGDLPEELAEVVEEAVEAVAEGKVLPEEVAAIVEEVIAEEDPDTSIVLEPEEAEKDCTEAKNAGDTFRQALRAIRPALREMTPRDSSRVCADIAARLGFVPGQKATDDRLPEGRRTGTEEAYADLGKRIMARRNPTYKGGKE